MKPLAAVILVAILAGCDADEGWSGSIEGLLETQTERFATVMADPARYRIQVIYTQIDRDADNRPSFRSFSYRLDPGEYFYPASTVKLPTAALALEKINALNLPGLDRNSVMLTGSAADFQTEVTLDASSPTGFPTVANYIRKILVVSDNDAFNRLYEFIGQAPLNDALRAKGYTGTRIVHRLEVALTPEQNRQTNPVQFMNAGSVIYQQPPVRSERSFLGSVPQPLGVAEIVDGHRVERPKDFSEKNAYPLQELHDTVRALMFPETIPPEQRFSLTPDQYRFLRRYMSAYPSESGIGQRPDGSYYPEGYVKILMFGGSAPEVPDHIRIFNKVGDAYGFLTDAAYVVDFKNGVEFLLAATIYTNANGTFNDNEYEYDQIGFPFLRDLGQAIYEVEMARPRAHRPDFGELASLHATENR